MRVRLVLMATMLLVASVPTSPLSAQTCTLQITGVEDLSVGNNLQRVVVSGTASDCRQVRVGLACMRQGGTRQAPVTAGGWEVAFEVDELKRGGCTCHGRMSLDVKCLDQGRSCEASLRRSVDCKPDAGSFEYAVKFACGRSDGELAAPGHYFTSVNVHNPGESGVLFRKKVAVARAGQHPGPISRFVEAKLGPDEAFAVECREIGKLAEVSDGFFVDGFLIFQTPSELDVVALYSGTGKDGALSTLAVERVPPRAMRRPDPGKAGE